MSFVKADIHCHHLNGLRQARELLRAACLTAYLVG